MGVSSGPDMYVSTIIVILLSLIIYAAVLEINFTKSFYKVESEGTLDICLEAVGLAQIDPGDKVPIQLMADHPGIINTLQ